MTTLNRNLHKLNINKKNEYQQKTQFMSEKLSTHTENSNLTEDHRSLIEEIKSKNSLLVKVQNDKNNQSAKNLPTFCQKYVNVLYKKYRIGMQPKFSPIKSREVSVKYFTQEQQFHRNIFLCKQFLHMTEQDFQQSIGQLSIRLKQISNYLSSKCRNLKENDKSIEEQLTALEFFSSKFTNKIPNNHITPFFLYSKDIIKSQSSIIRTQSQAKDNNKKAARIQSYYNNLSNFDKKGLDSNLIGDNSPNLLSGFDEKENDNENNLYMSFKPNLETSQNCFSTLKYSQSELNLNFSKNNKNYDNSKAVNKQDEHDSLPFSPVQPYRLHKIQAEIQNSKRNTFTDKLSILLKSDDDFIDSVTEQLSTSIKKGTKKQYNLTGHMMQIYSQSVDEFSKTIQKTHQNISQENRSMQEQWTQISIFLHKDIQEMYDLLQLEKTENEIKDKKFLQNLDMIQNQLIEDIFAEKQYRKADEKVLTQVLANLIDSIQRNQ